MGSRELQLKILRRGGSSMNKRWKQSEYLKSSGKTG